MEKKKITAKERYDKKNTVFYGLKLNKKTDADIIAAIGDIGKQTKIKELLRKAINNS